MSSAFLSNNGKVYFCGWKLVFRPKLFEMDYEKHKVKTFCSTDKGIAVVTEDNNVFYNGNFWSGKAKNENIETGVK